jgi:pimeloyl-ACP methyl ester carboxylesterase
VRWAAAALVYALLVAASNAWQALRPAEPGPTPAGLEVVGLSNGMALAHRDNGVRSDRVPIVLLHGLPGDGAAFEAMQALFAGLDRRAIAPDVPGMGFSDPTSPSMSSAACADAVLDGLARLGVERFHLLGWSNGGAVALHMADAAPERVASLTLLGSVGTERAEGSGSHLIEHAKYKLGRTVLGPGLELVPHFGALGHPERRTRWLRIFDDTDLRPMDGLMRGLATPTLILHGRHDFLTPAWGAEHHQAIMPGSTLVMVDSDHFMPFMEPGLAVEHVGTFLAQHDGAGVAPSRATLDLAPVPARGGPAEIVRRAGLLTRGGPWWAIVPVLALLARWRPETATAFAGLLVGRVDLDLGVAWMGLAAGRWSRPDDLVEGPRGVVARARAGAWSGVSLGLASLAGGLIDRGAPAWGGWAIVPLTALVAAALWHMRRAWTLAGRATIASAWTRLTNHEWWPTWAVYLPVLPMWLGRLARPGGVLAFTALNRAIPNGGGLVGESKSAILDALAGDEAVLAHESIEPGTDPGVRAQRALDAIRTRPELGGFPIICKPDMGERGASVRLARSDKDVRRYFALVKDPVVVQRFDAGPAEYGVFWARVPGRPQGGLRGEIVAITGKHFAEVTGDGVRTLRELILRHRRFRVQARVFFERLRARLDEVPAVGQVVRLGTAGNHAQGCRFSDETDLATPELCARIERLFAHAGDGVDIGRLDVRCESASDLRRGEFRVIELNGVLSEATNIYDPEWTCWRCWGLMRRVWERLYALADEAVAAGHRPMPVRRALGLWWRHRGSSRLRAD